MHTHLFNFCYKGKLEYYIFPYLEVREVFCTLKTNKNRTVSFVILRMEPRASCCDQAHVPVLHTPQACRHVYTTAGVPKAVKCLGGTATGNWQLPPLGAGNRTSEKAVCTGSHLMSHLSCPIDFLIEKCRFVFKNTFNIIPYFTCSLSTPLLYVRHIWRGLLGSEESMFY